MARSWDALVGETSDRLHRFFSARGVAVHVDQSGPIATLAGASAVERADLGRYSDLLIAIGGDGTMLDAAQLAQAAHEGAVELEGVPLDPGLDLAQAQEAEALGLLEELLF
ncbi:MAG: hypothetical protein AAFU65_14185, partial [Pseudomonadota bacterium]